MSNQKAQAFMHSKKENVKRAQKQGSADGSKAPTRGGRQRRPQPDRQIGTPRGEVGSPFNGGQPPQFGDFGARPQPTPGPGGRPGPGIPRGEVGGNVFDSNRPPQFGDFGARPQPPGGRPAPGRGGGENTIGIPRGEVGGNVFDSNRPPQFGGGPRKFGGDNVNMINR